MLNQYGLFDLVSAQYGLRMERLERLIGEDGEGIRYKVLGSKVRC